MKKIFYLFVALLSSGFCYGQTVVRRICLDDYPAQTVKFNDIGILFQRISPDWESDKLQIAKDLYSVFRMTYMVKASDTEIESDSYFGTVSLVKGNELLFKADSIGMVGPIDYSLHYDKLVIPLILDQSQDNLDTYVDLYLVDLRTKKSYKINNEPIFNSEYGCITEDGRFVIYGSAGKLYKYDIEKRTTECMIDFENPTLFIFKLIFGNDTLTIY